MDGKFRIERVVLLGLVTLLGTTATLVAAITGLVISAMAALAVIGVDSALRKITPASAATRWALLLTVGFVVSWLGAGLAPYAAVIPAESDLFLRIAGVSPIVFYAASKETSHREVIVSWAQFAVMMIGTGAVRELFGRGTLFGFLVTGGFTVPADFFASSMGAFLVVAATVLGARIVARFAGITEASNE